MNLIPGVRMEFRHLGSGVLMSIRGYGVQTNFNGNGFKAYYNDISLTDAAGTTALDEVDYTNLSNIEVYKGPSSSIYGTNIAGVLVMRSAKAPPGTNIYFLGGFWRLIRFVQVKYRRFDRKRKIEFICRLRSSTGNGFQRAQ